jgi:muramoyltetrapeptide carboxypeptidase LdcA involved in peptidoglycan recycling
MRREEMSEWDILKGLDTVKAPPDFEQKVMAQLSLRKRVERRRRAVLRWSMAGSFASLAAVVFLLNVFVFQGRSPSGIAERGKGISPASSMMQSAAYERTVSILETLDYRTEMRSRSSEPETIYLLEQISDTTPRGIRY